MLKATLTKTGTVERNVTLNRARLTVSTGKTANISYNLKHDEEKQYRSPLRRTQYINGWRQPLDYDRTIRLYGPFEGSCVVNTYTSSGVLQYVDTYTGSPAIGTTYANTNLLRILSSTGQALWSQNDLFRSHTEVLVKLKDAKVNYGESLAEARKTFNHLSSTALSVLKAYRYARRGKWSKVLKTFQLSDKRRWSTSKEASARWLELSFAWTPLLSDIQGTYELLQTQLRTTEMLYSVVREITTRIDGSDITPTLANYRENKYIGDGFLKTKTKVYFRIKNEDLAFATSLGLTDPLQVAWALVPFSFMIDWFLPIGTCLEALGATKGLEFVSGTDVRYIQFTGRFYCTPVALTNSMTSTGLFSCPVSITGTRREVLNQFPRPFLYYKSPFSTSHGISALAVLRTIL